MAYQETTKTSYGQRLTGSFKAIGSGFLMFIIGTILLFWNEGNFVKTRKAIQEAEGAVVRVSDVSNVNSELNGKLIHASAFANTSDILVDGLFGFSEVAIALSRKVEYYQYEEKSSTNTRDRIGGGQETVTTYTYEKKWTTKPVNSTEFKDPDYKSSNFVLTTVEAKTERAQNVSFGGYKLPPYIISSISGNVPATVNLNKDELAKWERIIAQTLGMRGLRSNEVVNKLVDDATTKILSPDSVDTGKMVHVNGNVVYFGKSPAVQHIGDVRITLTKVMPADISIIAKVVGNTFEQYIASNGKTVSSISMGTVSAEKMFAGEHSSNSMWTWIYRILGVLLVIGGLKSMFSILPTLFKVLPFLGNIVEAGVGLVCSIFGFAWSFIIIAIAWLFYRPLIGVALLAVAIAGIWFLKKKAKERKG
jgi:hypothetical protein